MGCNPTPTERSRCSWGSVRRESRAYSAPASLWVLVSAPEPFIWSPPNRPSMSANARTICLIDGRRGGKVGLCDGEDRNTRPTSSARRGPRWRGACGSSPRYQTGRRVHCYWAAPPGRRPLRKSFVHVFRPSALRTSSSAMISLANSTSPSPLAVIRPRSRTAGAST